MPHPPYINIYILVHGEIFAVDYNLTRLLDATSVCLSVCCCWRCWRHWRRSKFNSVFFRQMKSDWADMLLF